MINAAAITTRAAAPPPATMVCFGVTEAGVALADTRHQEDFHGDRWMRGDGLDAAAAGSRRGAAASAWGADVGAGSATG